MVCAPRRRKKSCRSLNSAPSNLTPCGVSSSPKLHLITHICFCSEPKNIDLLVFCKYTLSAVSRPRLQVPNTPHRNLKHSLTDGSVEAQWRQPSQLRRLPRAARASRAADRHRRNQQQSRNRIARLKIRPAPILRVSLRPQRSRLPISRLQTTPSTRNLPTSHRQASRLRRSNYRHLLPHPPSFLTFAANNSSTSLRPPSSLSPKSKRCRWRRSYKGSRYLSTRACNMVSHPRTLATVIWVERVSFYTIRRHRHTTAHLPLPCLPITYSN